ncbi:SCO family protein [Pelagicoccus sp. NFK12]|uniref:SCO family protein n=1 Tax=Pelagicoccus enzymogenes TaxID=2773457 RepID=A0A927F798_9BACT|nr:SCO family protein [Pelagicoccus enzymogenes]MBD5779753.1 SCO family protein [Pelagicoccus enzymogenes]MDQ8200271.1 SCO family protein [Pelagicoccus enzymogenes]
MKIIAPATLLVVLAAPLALNASCPMHPKAPPELQADHSCCRIAQEKWEAALAKIAPSELSLYQVTSEWQTQSGNKIVLADLAGHPQFVALAYTNCQYACPRLIADLKAIEYSLPADSEAKILIVSIDPARDTPERLAAYASEQELDTSRWTLLNGAPGDVLELANLLGVRYAKTPTGDYTHSNIITLLNAKGEIVHQQNGLGADNKPTLEKLAKLDS